MSVNVVPGRARLKSAFAMLLALLIGATMLSPVTSVAQEETPVQGGVLRQAMFEDPDSLDPARASALLSRTIMDALYDRLVYIGADGLPKGSVAESFTISDDSLTITFKIRQGITFHDGTALDAAAVKFSFDRILDPALASPSRDNLGPVTSVEAPDATTVVFTFSAPFAPFFTNLSLMFDIVSPAAVQEKGDEFGRSPVGSGPFMFESWELGTKLTLVRNPNYVNHREDDANKGPAHLDGLEWHVIAESATQTAAFESDEIDVLAIPLEDIERMKSTEGVAVLASESVDNLNFLMFADRPPFNNEYFRRAIGYAIDRDTIIDIVQLGAAVPAICPIPVGNAAYDDAVCAEHGFTYDLEKAKQELAAGGFVDSDGNGIVEMDGQDLEVTLWTYAPYPAPARTIELIQADLNQIGLKVEIQSVEFAAMVPMLESGEIGMYLMRTTYGDQAFVSNQLKSPGWTGQVHDAELDALITVADTTLDPAARIAATQQAMIYVLQKGLLLPIHSDVLPVAVNDNVHGFRWDAINRVRYIDIWIAG